MHNSINFKSGILFIVSKFIYWANIISEFIHSHFKLSNLPKFRLEEV